MLTFPRVPLVAKRQRITSMQLIALANAINARIRSGLGDWAWRTNKHCENQFRQVRNPNEDGILFPAQGEFFNLYQLIEPETGSEWPVSGPGEPEGANLANPMNQFVFGNPIMDSEDERLGAANFPLTLPSSFATSLTDIWNLGKDQRGAIAQDGSQSTPALNVALSWFGVQTPYYSPQGKTYGGYFPSPTELLEHCDSDTASPYWFLPSLEIFFTNLQTGATVTYIGTCPSAAEFGGAGNVLEVKRTPISYYVYVDDGAGGYTLDVYPRSTWIQGPYTGDPVLAHGEGELTERALWSFIKDFRGATSQRVEPFKIRDHAFDFQKFLTRQYPLSPNFGYVSGDNIEALYPTARINSDAYAGTFLPFVGVGGGSDKFTYEPGFVCAGIFAAAVNLSAQCTLDVLDQSGRIIGSLTLDAGAARTEAVLWLDRLERPESIRVKLKSAAKFGIGGGSLGFEANQLFPYKPQYYDAYLVLRDSATIGGVDVTGAVDGGGVNETESKEIYETFASNGCILNRHSAAGPMQLDASITPHPVFDAMRRMTREYMRILADDQFVSYEVSGGKSILRFNRYAFGASNDIKADCFYKIAPPYQAIDYDAVLTPGEKYCFRGTGTAKYGNRFFVDGDHFTATSDYDSINYDPDHFTNTIRLYIYEGIKTVALPKQFTNEWVFYVEPHVSHWSESSEWKESAYAKYFTGINRSQFYSGAIRPDSRFAAHINYSARPVITEDSPGVFATRGTDENIQPLFINPESPPGYSYAEGTNAGASIQFYKSCQIYKAPYEIESATVEIIAGQEFVKLIFKTRFQSHASAPSTVSPDTFSWSPTEISDLRTTEDYRTDDNLFREFFLMRAQGIQATFKIGDCGVGSIVSTLDDNPNGAVIPHGFLTKLMAKPPEDGNDTPQNFDARTVMDSFQHAELLLASGCEGFVDGGTTVAISCGSSGGLYDYNWERLCAEASGVTSAAPIDPNVAPDSVGFSALPMVKMYASQYNHLAACVNLLNKARIELPWTVESKLDSYFDTITVTPGVMNPVGCAEGDDRFALYNGSGLNASTQTSVGVFGPGIPTGASSSTHFNTASNYCDGSGGFLLLGEKNILTYRSNVDPLFADAINAVPALLQDLMAGFGLGFLANYQETKSYTKVTSGVIAGDATTCGSTLAFADGIYYKLESVTETIVDECRLLKAGTVDTGVPPSGSFGHLRTHSGSDHACNYGTEMNINITPFASVSNFYFEVEVV